MPCWIHSHFCRVAVRDHVRNRRTGWMQFFVDGLGPLPHHGALPSRCRKDGMSRKGFFDVLTNHRGLGHDEAVVHQHGDHSLGIQRQELGSELFAAENVDDFAFPRELLFLTLLLVARQLGSQRGPRRCALGT